MIIVKLSGGLGNQLFQYAFARAVSERLKTDFRLDINPFKTYYTFREYSLEHFNTKQEFAKDSDFFGLVWLIKQHNAFTTFYRYLRLKKRLMPFYYPERSFHFDPEVFTRNGTYFDGFWQTAKYFVDIEPLLREELTLKNPLSEKSQVLLEEIQHTNAVSLHVRRYETSADKNYSSTLEIHGTCTMEYYEKAMAYIARQEKDPHFFVFSDNYDWAVTHFKPLPYAVTCISSADRHDYEDLMLMASCKHHIIANSSFSWWGAWLDPNKNKIVIAPSRWFNKVKASVDTKDIIPDSWIKL